MARTEEAITTTTMTTTMTTTTTTIANDMDDASLLSSAAPLATDPELLAQVDSASLPVEHRGLDSGDGKGGGILVLETPDPGLYERGKPNEEDYDSEEVQRVIHWRPSKSQEEETVAAVDLTERRRPKPQPTSQDSYNEQEPLVYICNDPDNCPPPVPGLPYPPPAHSFPHFRPRPIVRTTAKQQPKRRFKPFIRKYSYRVKNGDADYITDENKLSTLYRGSVRKQLRKKRIKSRTTPTAATLTTTTTRAASPSTASSSKNSSLNPTDFSALSLEELQEIMKVKAGLVKDSSGTGKENEDDIIESANDTGLLSKEVVQQKEEHNTRDYDDIAQDPIENNYDEMLADYAPTSFRYPSSTSATISIASSTSTTVPTTAPSTTTPEWRERKPLDISLSLVNDYGSESHNIPDDVGSLLSDMMDLTTFGLKKGVKSHTSLPLPLPVLPQDSPAMTQNTPSVIQQFPNFREEVDQTSPSSYPSKTTTTEGTKTSRPQLQSNAKNPREENVQRADAAQNTVEEAHVTAAAKEAGEISSLRKSPGVREMPKTTTKGPILSKTSGNFIKFSMGNSVSDFNTSGSLLDLGQTREHEQEINTKYKTSLGESGEAEYDERGSVVRESERSTYDDPYKLYYHPSHRYQEATTTRSRPTEYPTNSRYQPFTIRLPKTTSTTTTTTTTTPFTVTPTTTKPKLPFLKASSSPQSRPYRRRFRPYQSAFFGMQRRPPPPPQLLPEKSGGVYDPPHGNFLDHFTAMPTIKPRKYSYSVQKTTTTPFTVKPTSTLRMQSSNNNYNKFSIFTVRPTTKVASSVSNIRSKEFAQKAKASLEPYETPFTVSLTTTAETTTSSPPPFTVQASRTLVPKTFVQPHITPGQTMKQQMGIMNPDMFSHDVFLSHDVELKEPFDHGLPAFYTTKEPPPPPPPRPNRFNHRYPPRTTTRIVTTTTRRPTATRDNEEYVSSPYDGDDETSIDGFVDFSRMPLVFGEEIERPFPDKKAAFPPDGEKAIDVEAGSLRPTKEKTIIQPRHKVKQNKTSAAYLKNPYGSNFIRLEVDEDRFRHNKSAIGIRHVPLMVFRNGLKKSGSSPSVPHRRKKKPSKFSNPMRRPFQLSQLAKKPSFIPPVRVPPFTSIRPRRKSLKVGNKQAKRKKKKPQNKEMLLHDVMETLPGALQRLPGFVQKLVTSSHPSSSPSAWLAGAFNGRELDRR